MSAFPSTSVASVAAPDDSLGAPGAAGSLTEWADSVTRDTLQVLADGITELAGFGVAAVSVARSPGQLQVMAVAGSDEARSTLLGTFTPVDRLMGELAKADDWGMFKFVPAERLDPEDESWGWVPDVDQAPGPDGWHPLDLLIAPLYDVNGAMCGSLSIDLPGDRRRPDAARRGLLNRYAAQAARAVGLAMEREELGERVRLLSVTRDVVRNASRLLRIGPMMEQVRPAVIEGFGALDMWMHTFDEDGHGQGKVYAEGGAELAMPPELVAIGERAASEAWQQRRVALVSRTRVMGSAVLADEADQILGFLEQTGVGSLLFVPMGAAGECLGSLVLTRSLHAPDWSDLEIDTALDLGQDLGWAVLNARSYERESQLVRELQDLDVYKTQLIATLSHELKSPLAAILANVELLAHTDDLAEDVQSVCRAVDRGALRLVRVVEDMLLLAKVGDPHSALVARPVELRSIVADVVDLTALEARRRGVRVTVDAPAGCLAMGDASELDLVVSNLVGNAIKYTPRGGQVTVSLSGADDGPVLGVSDTGIGISHGDQARLFDEFFRSTNPVATAEPGTGLGLSIVERIVRRHHGRVEVSSQLGRGSTFRVLLPAAPPTAELPARPGPQPTEAASDLTRSGSA